MQRGPCLFMDRTENRGLEETAASRIHRSPDVGTARVPSWDNAARAHQGTPPSLQREENPAVGDNTVNLEASAEGKKPGTEALPAQPDDART